MKIRFIALLATLQLTLLLSTAQESPNREVSQSQEPPPQASLVSPRATAHDGAHDFDFLIGNWKAHVRRLPDRLVGSNTWIEYDGISNHKKLLDTNANFGLSIPMNFRNFFTTRARIARSPDRPLDRFEHEHPESFAFPPHLNSPLPIFEVV
jgi:hypothetical protein